MIVAEILIGAFIVLDADGTFFLTHEIATYNGCTRATVEQTGTLPNLLNQFNPLSIVWMN